MRTHTPIVLAPLVLAVVLAACSVSESQELDGNFDSFGGDTAIKGKATGFFHLEEIDGRHFLITPEGNGYRALGINHFHNMTSKDYDEAIRNIKQWGFNAGCYQGPRPKVDVGSISLYQRDQSRSCRDVHSQGPVPL